MFRLIGCLVLLLAAGAAAQVGANPSERSGDSGFVTVVEQTVPLVIKLSGDVTSNGDTSVFPRLAHVRFNIFKSSEGGEPLWSEDQNLQIDIAGHYVALLGSIDSTGIPVDIFSRGDAQWLEVTVDGNLQTPRSQLLSVPYALKAADADTLAGKPASEYVLADQIPSLLDKTISVQRTAKETNANLAGAGSIFDLYPIRLPIRGPIGGRPTPAPAPPNTFVQPQFFLGGLTLLPPVAASKNSPSGTSSSTLDLVSSAFNSSSNSSENEYFRWRADPLQSNSAAPSAQLNLLYGSGSGGPQPTGFSFNRDGTINFAALQVVPLAAIQSALSDAGLPSGNGTGTAEQAASPVVKTGTYYWQQTPGGNTPLVPGQNVVKLSPCPRGVNGTDLWHYFYITGTGTPESVLMTGGTCTPGLPTGTVEFTAANPHPAGYQIESATGGVQEAIIDAITPNSNAQESRSVLITPGSYNFHARLSIRASSIHVSVSGATITCLMKDTCIMLGDPSNSNNFQAITIDGVRVSAGVPQGTWSALEDNAEGSTINDMGTASGQPSSSFGHLIQVDNDQAAHIDHLTATLAVWSRCDLSFCSSAIYGPGTPDVNAGVIWVTNANLSFQCGANGIDNFDGNSLHVTDSVIQGYAQFGVRSYAIYDDMPDSLFSNVHEEVGNCQNPLGTGIAGLISMGGYSNASGGAGPIGSIPQYANTGNIQYNYYVVAHSSTLGDSPVFLAGTALTNGTGRIPVKWNEIGRQGTITYDVLRSLSANSTAPFGTGDFAVAVGLTQSMCSNQVCLFSDDASVKPSSYAVPTATYAPSLRLWPGAVILTKIGDSATTGLIASRFFTDGETLSGFVSSSGTASPSVFAQNCPGLENGSPIWMQCEAGDPGSVATLVQMGTSYGIVPGQKGKWIFSAPVNVDLPATHIITLADSNPPKTMAASGNRPSWDIADAYIGYDQPSPANDDQAQIAFGSPVSLSNYIANPGDGKNWLERLTINLKTFKVPVVAPTYRTASNCVSASGSCGSAAAGITAIAPGSTTITISDTSVTSLSQITPFENITYGNALGVTCDTNFGRQYRIFSQTPGIGFVIETNVAPIAWACLSFTLEN